MAVSGRIHMCHGEFLLESACALMITGCEETCIAGRIVPRNTLKMNSRGCDET
jgi:hypothetical protein